MIPFRFLAKRSESQAKASACCGWLAQIAARRRFTSSKYRTGGELGMDGGRSRIMVILTGWKKDLQTCGEGANSLNTKERIHHETSHTKNRTITIHPTPHSSFRTFSNTILPERRGVKKANSSHYETESNITGYDDRGRTRAGWPGADRHHL